jgi:hypothetical protein
MFDSVEELAGKLADTGYFIDPVMTQVVFLAAKLQKPLLLEGPPGSGNPETEFFEIDRISAPRAYVGASPFCALVSFSQIADSSEAVPRDFGGTRRQCSRLETLR